MFQEFTTKNALFIIACFCLSSIILQAVPARDIVYDLNPHHCLAHQAKRKADVKPDPWVTFYADLTAAVKKRDRGLLRKMMSEDFSYTFGPTPSDDLREDAFKFWDDPQINGWKHLDDILSKGALIYQKQQPLTRIAPPAAKNKKYTGWRAFFEMRDDGKWYWTAFVEGD